MNRQSIWLRIIAGSMVALVVLIGGALLFPIATSASGIAQVGDGPESENESPLNVHWGWPGARYRLAEAIDYEAHFAEALGISVEELQAAKDAALEAALADAVEAGTLIQEQADMLLAYSAVREAVDKDSLAAEALGMNVEEFEAALADGTSLVALIDEAGMSFAEFGAAMEDAYEAAVQQLVEDGAIAQEQADQILDRGFRFGRRFRH